MSAPAGNDRGRAVERTALAWTRSALALAAIGAIALTIGAERAPHALGYVVGAVVELVAAVVWAHGRLTHGARRRAVATRRGAAGARPLALLAAAAALTATAAIALAVVASLPR